MKSIVTFILKILLFILPVLLMFGALFRVGYSPVITNSTLFDMKMVRLQKQRINQVDVMTIGSSVSLYELNSDSIVQNLHKSYYNFASWGLQVSDMRVLLNCFVKDYRPRYILIGSSIGDFVSPSNDSYLNYVTTNAYFRKNLPEIFYFKNYTSIHQIIRRKHTAFPVVFDHWGGAKLSINQQNINYEKWNEHDIFPTKYTADQYRQLDSLSAWLNTLHIKLVFAQAPIKASYANTPASKQILQLHFNQCKSIIKKNGGIYLNYYNTGIFTDSLFFDQYHLQTAGGNIFTKELVSDLKKIIK